MKDYRMEQGTSKVKFKYVFDKTYNPSYATGAFGGLTPKGDIVVNFFMERQPIPYSEVREVDTNGVLSENFQLEPKQESGQLDIVRFIESGAMMNLETAKELYEWLGQTISLAEEQ